MEEGLKEVMDTVNSVEGQRDVLSSVMCDADQIVVLEEGKVVEIGQHDQLASEDGLYSRLVRRQLSAARR